MSSWTSTSTISASATSPDDIFICNISITSCNSIVSELAQKVEVVNNGEVRSSLYISVTRNYPHCQQAISIAQPGYMDPLLAKYNLSDAIPHIYTLHSRAACSTIPQINSQLLYCLHIRCELRQRRGQQKILHWLRVYCQRRRNNLVNSQLTSNHSQAIARTQFFRTKHELQIPSAIHLHPAKYRQAKHIDVRYHAVRHHIHDGRILHSLETTQ
jgi:hypothetical protein